MTLTDTLIVTGVCTLTGSLASLSLGYAAGWRDAGEYYRAAIRALTERLNEVLIIQSFPHNESRFDRLMQSREEKTARMNGVAR